MIVTVKLSGINIETENEAEYNAIGFESVFVPANNISSIGLLKADRSSIGADCVALNLMNRSKYEVEYTSITINAVQPQSNQEVKSILLQNLYQWN